jgi:hypothetical protein
MGLVDEHYVSDRPRTPTERLSRGDLHHSMGVGHRMRGLNHGDELWGTYRNEVECKELA